MIIGYDIRMLQNGVWIVVEDSFETVKSAKVAVKRYKKEDAENKDSEEYKIFAVAEFEVK